MDMFDQLPDNNVQAAVVRLQTEQRDKDAEKRAREMEDMAKARGLANVARTLDGLRQAAVDYLKGKGITPPAGTETAVAVNDSDNLGAAETAEAQAAAAERTASGAAGQRQLSDALLGGLTPTTMNDGEKRESGILGSLFT